MPALPTVTLFLLAALVLLLIPGPAVLYITTQSIAQGRRAGLASVAGIQAGTFTHVLAAALGVSALVMTSVVALSALKYLGAAYLVCLGLRTWLTPVAETGHRAAAPKTVSALFVQGFVVNVLNPKTALFFFAFLPQFIDQRRGPVAGQVLFLGVVFVALAFCTDGMYALLAGTLGQRLRQWAGFVRARRYVAGAVYLALGITAALAGGTKIPAVSR